MTCHPIPQLEHMNKMGLVHDHYFLTITGSHFPPLPRSASWKNEETYWTFYPWMWVHNACPIRRDTDHVITRWNITEQKTPLHRYESLRARINTKVVPAHAIKALEGEEVKLQWFLSSELVRGSSRLTFTPGNEPPTTTAYINQEARLASEPFWTLWKKDLSPLPGMEPLSPGRPARRWIATPTTLSAPH